MTFVYYLVTEDMEGEDDEVTLRKVTLSFTEARRWLHKKFKTRIPSYRRIEW